MMRYIMGMTRTFPIFTPSRLKALRELKGLSHESFGLAIDRTKQTIIAWEKGRTVPDVNDLETIGRVFDIDPTWFWVVAEMPNHTSRKPGKAITRNNQKKPCHTERNLAHEP